MALAVSLIDAELPGAAKVLERREISSPLPHTCDGKQFVETLFFFESRQILIKCFENELFFRFSGGKGDSLQ